MINSIQRYALYLFLALSTLGFCLYVGFFSFFLVKINTSPIIISVLIGATALSSLFWGPVAGRMIDRTKHKYLWLIVAQICCGLFIFCFGNLEVFRPILMPLLVLSFSLMFNFAVIIINQYLLPMLHDDYEESVALASRVTGLAVLISGLTLAVLYDCFPPFVFFAAAAACYILSAATLILVLHKNKYLAKLSQDLENSAHEKSIGVYRQTFYTIGKHWFLALSMCVLAFTETSFNTNFDVIAFSLGTTPYAVVFLLGALSGALDSAASWIYPRLMGNMSIRFKWYFFLAAFLLVFGVATLLSYNGWDKNAYFLPTLAVILELIGVWWSIFIAGRVRDTSSHGTYGQTMAAFRVPRSLVTFIGVTSIGTALQAGKLEWILLFNTALLTLLLVTYIWSTYGKRSKITATKDYKSF
ncbi:hypothetical protein [Rahnella sp. PAMC 25559]|uniref:hypothetical protein n=1 Tax=Rahnella sp. PAMC 25559 TaxID=3423225 RepID=UPI003D669129